VKLYTLPPALRQRLSKPVGKLFSQSEIDSPQFKVTLDASLVITVGDRTTETIFRLGRTPDIQVVDLVEMRKARDEPKVPFKSLIRVRNPAGKLTEEAIRGICGAFKTLGAVRVLVTGEEDLLVLPAIARAPSGSSLYYGQPSEGIVFVRIDQASKDSARAIIREMGASRIEDYDV
jgi:uncharacterized protein (UPF0218 family)